MALYVCGFCLHRGSTFFIYLLLILYVLFILDTMLYVLCAKKYTPKFIKIEDLNSNPKSGKCLYSVYIYIYNVWQDDFS